MPAANPLGRAFTEAHAGGDGRGAEQDLWSSMLSAIPAEIRVALNRLNADYRKRSIRGLPTTAGTVLARELLHVLGTGSGPDAESWDADVRRLLREWSMFQSAQARYEALLVDAAESALARMSERIAERAAGGRPLNTVRAAYDLWIECSETSYAALLASDDFADAHASAINALVVVKAGCSRLGDRVGELLNAPSRQAYSSLEQRLHAARREQRRQRERLDQLERHCEGLDDRLRVLEGPPADSTKRERS
jgi:hypothetical protein